jgi:hypothetical protein
LLRFDGYGTFLAAEHRHSYNEQIILALVKTDGLLEFPAMNMEEDAPYAQLESAIARWNAKVGVAYGQLSHTFEECRAKLESITTLLASRRTLSTSLVVARVKMDAMHQEPEQRMAVVASLMEHIAGLEEHLTTYNVELQTLSAQSARVIEAGKGMAEELVFLHGRKESDLPPPLQEELSPKSDVYVVEESPSDSEALRISLGEAEEQLATTSRQAENQKAQIEALQAELTEARALIPAIQGEGEGPPANFSTESDVLVREETTISADASTEETAISEYEHIRLHAFDSEGRKRPMGAILVEANVITSEQLEHALREKDSSWNRHLGAVLVELGYTSEDTIARALAAQINLPFVELRDIVISKRVCASIPGPLAQQHTCVPIGEEQGCLIVAMANPLDLVALQDIELATSRHIQPMVAPAQDIRAAIKSNYLLH